MDQLLRKIIEGVSNTRGDDFLTAITLQLASIIGAQYTFIARIDTQKYISKTIALVANGEIVDNIEYSLSHTPCANVADNSVCIYPEAVTNLFPRDQLLVDMKIEAYLGTPLIDSHGKVIGIIVALYENKISNSEHTLTLFEIFSGRIAAELERVDYEQQLINLNNSLEQRVKDRTTDLETTLSTLKQTQQQLVESEKIAALGNLVASVAHEVNTPLGVAITGHSLLEDSFKSLIQRFNSQTLTKSTMEEFQTLYSETLPLVSNNLQRAKLLINNFKDIAADQHSDVKETISILNYYQQILSTLSPLMKRHDIHHTLVIDDRFKLHTFPGAHGQIITNLITNSIRHGFKGLEDCYKAIKIEAEVTTDASIIRYSDNGIGLDDQSRQFIFEPFYTTARETGGTGLGMSIAFNLVKHKLKGDVRLLSPQQGFGIEFTLPSLHASGEDLLP